LETSSVFFETLKHPQGVGAKSEKVIAVNIIILNLGNFLLLQQQKERGDAKVVAAAATKMELEKHAGKQAEKKTPKLEVSGGRRPDVLHQRYSFGKVATTGLCCCSNQKSQSQSCL